jgi:hypothetical protein
MRASNSSPASRPTRAKPPPRRRLLQSQQKREHILRERVTYMLWVMANRID